MARPFKEIGKAEFEKLCGLQCTKEEICGWFSITDKTLDAWCKREYKQSYSEVYKEKRSRGKISLRRAQFQLAEKNSNMAIWLGKQYLDQKDKHEVMAGATGSLADLIDGLKEPCNADDLYTEAAGADGAMADESPAEN